MIMVMPDSLPAFLSDMPTADGVHQLSTPRDFHHPEELYDQLRPAWQCTPEFLEQEGANVLAFLREQGGRPDLPLLEIGCGSGWLSASLASRPEFAHLLCTDPSPAFVRATRRRLSPDIVRAGRADCALLRAEDVDLLPPGSVSTILMRSVLHHIADVPGFLRRCAAVLPPGGLLICEEPFYDGYIMMGFLAQFIPDALAAAGTPCSPEELARVDNFIATMQFYGRRDVDKSDAEDKHLFRPEELHVAGREACLDLASCPNWYFTLSAESNQRNRTGHFERFFAGYIYHCMNWPQEFCSRVTAAMQKYFRFFDPLESGGNTAPHCFGVFVFTRRP
jgi:SAM-dependent methyltransferase